MNAQGKISIPEGSRARKEQIKRLTDEAILVIDGRVDMKKYAWQPSVDELVWGPLAFGDPDEGSM